MITRDLKPENRISYSEIKRLLSCSFAHDLSYNERIQVIGHRSDALTRGTLNHEVMGVYFETRMNAERSGISDPHAYGYQQAAVYLLTRELDEFEEKFRQPLTDLLNFFYKANPLPAEHYKIRSFEQDFGIKLMEDYYYVFSPDLVVEHVTGKLYVVDLKTIYKFYTNDIIDLDHQLPSYVWGLRQFGIEIADAAFLMFRHGYAKTRSVTAGEVIRLEFLGLSEKRIANVVSQIYTAKQYKVNAAPMRVANDLVCNRCELKTLCIETLNGTDVAPLIGTYFEYKEERVMEGVTVNE